ncbi:MAG: hypothetical protein M1828_003331 [Chrysothrix sp. TS-e1954]|nr:MAG: hypothetical protein M1828_003331 [Chrysothrix sp. TS-e1954]
MPTAGSSRAIATGLVHRPRRLTQANNATDLLAVAVKTTSLTRAWGYPQSHRPSPPLTIPPTTSPPLRPLTTASPAQPSTTTAPPAPTPPPQTHTSAPHNPTTTTAILNPRTDDDGNPMHIHLTPRATSRLNAIMSTESNPDLCLRVSVESGGCHGFQYLMSLTDLGTVDGVEDCVFAVEGARFAEGEGTGTEGGGGAGSEMGDVGKGKGKAKIVLDQPSLELLKGSSIDYTMELIGSQFKVVGNPRASSSCGCGTSFDIE